MLEDPVPAHPKKMELKNERNQGYSTAQGQGPGGSLESYQCEAVLEAEETGNLETSIQNNSTKGTSIQEDWSSPKWTHFLPLSLFNPSRLQVDWSVPPTSGAGLPPQFPSLCLLPRAVLTNLQVILTPGKRMHHN